MIPVTLQEQIHEKKTRIASCETVIQLAKEELEELEKEQKQENTLSPFMRSIGTTLPKGVNSHTYNLRRNGWNAAMDYLIQRCERSAYPGWVHVNIMIHAIEK